MWYCGERHQQFQTHGNRLGGQGETVSPQKPICSSHRQVLHLNVLSIVSVFIGTRQQLNKVNIPGIVVGESNISPTRCVRNLGSWFDSELTMNIHITRTCSAAFFHLHNIKRMSNFFSRDSLLTLVHAFVTSRLDYCNSLLYGLPKTRLTKLQRVQNAAARLVSNTRRFEHITPVLRQLHWLPVSFRINFKILLLTFKSLHGLSPVHLHDLIAVRN